MSDEPPCDKDCYGGVHWANCAVLVHQASLLPFDGPRHPVADPVTPVDGYWQKDPCRHGCGRTVFIATVGPTCSYVECPDPTTPWDDGHVRSPFQPCPPCGNGAHIWETEKEQALAFINSVGRTPVEIDGDLHGKIHDFFEDHAVAQVDNGKAYCASDEHPITYTSADQKWPCDAVYAFISDLVAAGEARGRQQARNAVQAVRLPGMCPGMCPDGSCNDLIALKAAALGAIASRSSCASCAPSLKGWPGD